MGVWNRICFGGCKRLGGLGLDLVFIVSVGVGVLRVVGCGCRQAVDMERNFSFLGFLICCLLGFWEFDT